MILNYIHKCAEKKCICKIVTAKTLIWLCTLIRPFATVLHIHARLIKNYSHGRAGQMCKLTGECKCSILVFFLYFIPKYSLYSELHIIIISIIKNRILKHTEWFCYKKGISFLQKDCKYLTLLHSEGPKLYGGLAILSAVGSTSLLRFSKWDLSEKTHWWR